MELAHLTDRLAAILQRYPSESQACVACARGVMIVTVGGHRSRGRPRDPCTLGAIRSHARWRVLCGDGGSM